MLIFIWITIMAVKLNINGERYLRMPLSCIFVVITKMKPDRPPWMTFTYFFKFIWKLTHLNSKVSFIFNISVKARVGVLAFSVTFCLTSPRFRIIFPFHAEVLNFIWIIFCYKYITTFPARLSCWNSWIPKCIIQNEVLHL